MRDVIREIFRNDFEDAEYKGKLEGRIQGYDEGTNEVNERVATDMLRDGETIDKILRYSHLDKDTICNLARLYGITVV